MNIRRGLHRIFALGCICWAAYVLIGIPMQRANDVSTIAFSTWRLERDYVSKTTQSQAEYDAADKKLDSSLKRASIDTAYKDFLSTAPLYLPLMAILPPALIYGVSWMLFFIGGWLWRGFKQ